MSAVLGIREDRNYETPALQKAKERAEKYWRQCQNFGPIALDPETLAILNEKLPSRRTVFQVIATMALQKHTEFSYSDEDGHEFNFQVQDPGGRRWDQRTLAMVCQLAVETVRECIKELQEAGLLWFRAVPGRYTYIFVNGFQKFIKTRWWRSVIDGSLRKGKKLKQEASKLASRSGVSENDTHLLPPTAFRSLTSTVDVPHSESKTKKEEIPPDARAFLIKAKAEALRKL